MDQVMTVRGPVDASTLGFGLPHEHLRIDLISVFPAAMLAFDFQLIDEELQTDEVRLFRDAVQAAGWPGSPWIVDVTTDARMGRDPLFLRRVSESLDLPVVMGCGRYREPWYEPGFAERSTRGLAELLTAEIEQGVDGTGIRPGIIGELGADRDFVSPAEERTLRAAAIAHARTGLPITLHARFGQVGIAQLDILEDAGVRPERIIVGHTDTDPDLDYHEAIARRGAWVQYDCIRGRVPLVPERRVRYLLEARRRGFLDRVLLSHDVCALSMLRAYGGTGYDYLPRDFMGMLRERGLTDEELRGLVIEQPRRAIIPAV
ncbi:MAG: phosphotriesterase-related protein [Chloroflexi bacterium]|nr:phosphotriesterase-related protein [Chloroflexota bacterium]